MTQTELVSRFRSEAEQPLPLPGCGQTALRFHRLSSVAREDLSLARLLEAHWDAISILAEAGRTAESGCLYAVWASEAPQSAVELTPVGPDFILSGSKAFCSGAGLVDRALITVTVPRQQLVDVDLRSNAGKVHFDHSSWQTQAFSGTRTARATFDRCLVTPNQFIGCSSWYLERPGFWNGAIAPASCWAGGASGLIDYATKQSRSDPHTLAHLGALHSLDWALGCYLKAAGDEIDTEFIDVKQGNTNAGMRRALVVRHLVEQACSEVLQRLARAYGPHPLAMDLAVSSRCQELNLYIRQCHAERDLEVLGRDLQKRASA